MIEILNSCSEPSMADYVSCSITIPLLLSFFILEPIVKTFASMFTYSYKFYLLCKTQQTKCCLKYFCDAVSATALNKSMLLFCISCFVYSGLK